MMAVPSRTGMQMTWQYFGGAGSGGSGCAVEPGRLSVQQAGLCWAAEGSRHSELRLLCVQRLRPRSRPALLAMRRHLCHAAQALHQGSLSALDMPIERLCATLYALPLVLALILGHATALQPIRSKPGSGVESAVVVGCR